MTLKDIGLILVSLTLGTGLGYTLSPSELKGRLSACKDMTSVLNEALPLSLSCEIVDGDVYVSSPLQPGVKVSLDGKDIIK